MSTDCGKSKKPDPKVEASFPSGSGEDMVLGTPAASSTSRLESNVAQDEAGPSQVITLEFAGTTKVITVPTPSKAPAPQGKRKRDKPDPGLITRDAPKKISRFQKAEVAKKKVAVATKAPVQNVAPIFAMATRGGPSKKSPAEADSMGEMERIEKEYEDKLRQYRRDLRQWKLNHAPDREKLRARMQEKRKKKFQSMKKKLATKKSQLSGARNYLPKAKSPTAAKAKVEKLEKEVEKLRKLVAFYNPAREEHGVHDVFKKIQNVKGFYTVETASKAYKRSGGPAKVASESVFKKCLKTGYRPPLQQLNIPTNIDFWKQNSANAHWKKIKENDDKNMERMKEYQKKLKKGDKVIVMGPGVDGGIIAWKATVAKVDRTAEKPFFIPKYQKKSQGEDKDGESWDTMPIYLEECDNIADGFIAPRPDENGKWIFQWTMMDSPNIAHYMSKPKAQFTKDTCKLIKKHYPKYPVILPRLSKEEAAGKAEYQKELEEWKKNHSERIAELAKLAKLSRRNETSSSEEGSSEQGSSSEEEYEERHARSERPTSRPTSGKTTRGGSPPPKKKQSSKSTSKSTSKSSSGVPTPTKWTDFPTQTKEERRKAEKEGKGGDIAAILKFRKYVKTNARFNAERRRIRRAKAAKFKGSKTVDEEVPDDEKPLPWGHVRVSKVDRSLGYNSLRKVGFSKTFLAIKGVSELPELKLDTDDEKENAPAPAPKKTKGESRKQRKAQRRGKKSNRKKGTRRKITSKKDKISPVAEERRKRKKGRPSSKGSDNERAKRKHSTTKRKAVKAVKRRSKKNRSRRSHDEDDMSA